jgi:hypothetical protein
VKDLYARLGVDRGASAAEVRAALEIKPELSNDAAILLHTEKRMIYDSTHSTLKMIGELRFHLGLDTSRSWFLEHCPDYAFRKTAAKSRQDTGTGAAADTSASANPPPQQRMSVSPASPAQSKPMAKRLAKQQAKQSANWLLPAVLLIIVVILIAVLLRFLSE